MIRTISLLSSAALAALVAASPAFASGTASGESITNTISLSYESGGGTIDDPTAGTDTFDVDEKIDFSLVEQDSPTTATVSPGDTDEALTFLLTNEGNNARDFDIDVAQVGGAAPLGLTYDATGSGDPGTWSIYTSPNATGGPDTLYDPNGINGVGELQPDEQVYIKIVSSILNTASDGDEDTFNLTAQALNDAGSGLATESPSFGDETVELVFGDDGADNSEAGSEAYGLASATVSATKTVTVASEDRDGNFDCANDTAEAGALAFVPGACLDYTITLSNAAGASLSADSFSFTDALPGEVTYVTVFENNGFDNVSVGGSNVSGTINSLAPGDSADLTIRVTLD